MNMNTLFAVVLAMGFVGCGAIKHELRGAQGSPGESIVGPQGPEGQAAVVEVIDPCLDAPGIYDEVILRLANGQLLASFSQNASGLNTRFAILTPGSYQTTDGSNCSFTVTAEGDIQ